MKYRRREACSGESRITSESSKVGNVRRSFEQIPGNEWMDRAACRMPEFRDVNFFPGKNEDQAPAKAVCTQCVVKMICREYAFRIDTEFVTLGHGTVGIWGGLNQYERERIKKARRDLHSAN